MLRAGTQTWEFLYIHQKPTHDGPCKEVSHTLELFQDGRVPCQEPLPLHLPRPLGRSKKKIHLKIPLLYDEQGEAKIAQTWWYSFLDFLTEVCVDTPGAPGVFVAQEGGDLQRRSAD